MKNRIIEIADSPAKLRCSLGRLSIDRDGAEPVTIPFADVAVVIFAHPQITLTHPVLSELAGSGAMVITCDERRLPAAMLLPLQGHFVQTERFRLQAAASLPTRKRIWRDIVRAKIRAQAETLTRMRGDDHSLPALVPHVRSGDSSNVEAQAARRYWTALFPGGDFHRDADGNDQNRLLNYGYAVLRAIVARAICAAGLHPSLGLHHRNRYNAFCLADDLMEPLRPFVDQAVAQMVDRYGAEMPLSSAFRRTLLNALLLPLRMEEERRTIFDVVSRTASSLVEVFFGERTTILLPQGLFVDVAQPV